MELKNLRDTFSTENHAFLREDLTIDRKIAPCSLHELAPYIGKMRPELASWAIEHVSQPGDTIYDPFCGSGTVLLEGAIRGREVIGSDLNPYACLISKSKIDALRIGADSSAYWQSKIEKYEEEVTREIKGIDLRKVPAWIREFYHPETLRNTLAWRNVLKRYNDNYLLSCLLAIAHHQRPGFLSYPASHTVPYLRTSKFPRDIFPELYEQRAVPPRLIKKSARSARNIAPIKNKISAQVTCADAAHWSPLKKVDAIITSPPYMGQLHYARDNRLRLWLMGHDQWESLDKDVSPYANVFVERMIKTFENWSKILKPNGTLAVLVGDTSNSSRTRLDRLVAGIAEKSNGAFVLTQTLESAIPNSRRARKGCTGSTAEALLILKKKGSK
jgi:DNA modification methylase